jgi:flagellar M-ring protein FliF
MASRPEALPSPISALPAAIGGPLARARANPLVRRAALPAAIVTGIAAVGLGWLLLAEPTRAPLYSALPDGDKAAVVAALQEQGLPVALDPASGAVLLPPDDHARARMLLAAQGLPRAAPGGADLLADLPLGASRALEGARLKSAQERELARSIESLQGVEAARVIIAIPEASPFVRDRAPVTASVTVTLASGRTLSEAQSRAIVHLVAGAVPGLSPDRVAIADQTGRLLSGEPGQEESADDRRLAIQARMEARARDAILALLGPMLGPDKVSAQVAIELDFAAREAAREHFDRDGALRSESTQRATAAEPRAIGIPGALSNTVPAAATVSATPPPAVATGPTVSSTTSEAATRNYELGRSVEVTSNQGGQVRRLTAAVAIAAEALGPPAGRAAALREIEALVAGAVGADPARGDKVTVAAKPFAAPRETQVPLWREPVIVESSKWLAAALVVIGLMLFLVRPLVRPLAARLAKPGSAEARVLAGPDGQPVALEGNAAPGPPIDYQEKLTQARLLAATDTARATAVARRLLAEAPR